MSFTMVTKDETFIQEKPLPQGSPGASYRYFGDVNDKGDHPQAFVIALHNKSLQAHFHPVDQFQILLGGPGAVYRRTPIPEMMLHYADAFSTYGPFIGEDPPLRIVTLRAHPSTLTGKMPQMRDQLPWRGERLFHEEIRYLTPSEFPQEGVAHVDSIWPKAADNFEAFIVTAGPKSEINIPPTFGTDGQYVFVSDGSVTFNDKICEAESLAWHDRDEQGVQLAAGSKGSRVFVLRFGYPATPALHAQRVDSVP